MKTANGIKKLPINFDTDFEIQHLHDNSKMEEELNSDSENHSDTTESEADLEAFVMISNKLNQTADSKLSEDSITDLFKLDSLQAARES